MKWILTMLLVCLLYSSISAEDTDDWPMFQHDPQHSGYSSSRMPVSLKEVWTKESYCKVHPGEVYYLAISGDKIFVTNTMCFMVLDVNSGSELWSDQYIYAFSYFPAIGNNRLFFSDASVIRCHDVDTGEELWKLGVSFLTFSSPPIVVDEYVIVGGGHPIHSFGYNPETREEEERAWDYARRVMCLDSETGRIVWEVYLDNIATSPAYFNGKVYAVDGKHVYCLNVHTGKLLWKERTEWTQSSHLSLDGERIFVGTYKGIICLKLKTGKVLWKFGCDNEISETLAIAYSRVFTGDSDGVLYSVDAEKGDLIWKIETESRISSPIIVADKKVAFGTRDGMLYIVKAESGEICESLDFGDSFITALVLSDGKLFVGLEDGRVSCFEGDYIESAPSESKPANSSLTQSKPTRYSKPWIPFVFILISATLLISVSVWFRWKT